jgi:hypothetical protein
VPATVAEALQGQSARGGLRTGATEAND